MYRTSISIALSQETALWATMYTEESGPVVLGKGQAKAFVASDQCPWVGSSSQKQVDVMEPVAVRSQNVRDLGLYV